jgi:hypothetical protein
LFKKAGEQKELTCWPWWIDIHGAEARKNVSCESNMYRRKCLTPAI